jgi:predicted SAM-dependent methyltransferase
MKFLNLGCGVRYIKTWTNVDFIKTGPEVIACNFLQKIPFNDAAFDVVYHSHVLEHFSKEDGKNFIKECHRILKPGGVIRIAIPDLERIVKEYLANLEKALKGNKEAQRNYEWIMLEMYDQFARNESGGEMLNYWLQPAIENEVYVADRLGSEFTAFRKNNTPSQFSRKKSSKPLSMKEKMITWLSGDKDAINYLRLGKFRSRGEIHQWMYDRYSLGKLLSDTHFINIETTDAFSSSIPDWENYQWLDVDEGKTRKPDSIFMEAEK